MPIIDPKMMPVLPLECDSIVPNIFNTNEPRSWIIYFGHIKNFPWRLSTHLIMSASAFYAGAGIPQ
jgi:hypothetical protein